MDRLRQAKIIKIRMLKQMYRLGIALFKIATRVEPNVPFQNNVAHLKQLAAYLFQQSLLLNGSRDDFWFHSHS